MAVYDTDIQVPKPAGCSRVLEQGRIVSNGQPAIHRQVPCPNVAVNWPITGIGLCWEHEIEWREFNDRARAMREESGTEPAA